MSELTNLTDRISHLRDREGVSALGRANGPEKSPENKNKSPRTRRLPERRFAADYFMIFVYALLAIAIGSQFLLIAWLDLI